MKNKHSTPVILIWRTLSFLSIFIFLTSSVGFSPAKAQTPLQFEGTIAFVDVSGNIVIATGDGKQHKITSDAPSRNE